MGPGGGGVDKKKIYICFEKKYRFFFCSTPLNLLVGIVGIYIYTLFKYINLIVQKIYHKHFFPEEKGNEVYSYNSYFIHCYSLFAYIFYMQNEKTIRTIPTAKII